MKAILSDDSQTDHITGRCARAVVVQLQAHGWDVKHNPRCEKNTKCFAQQARFT